LTVPELESSNFIGYGRIFSILTQSLVFLFYFFSFQIQKYYFFFKNSSWDDLF